MNACLKSKLSVKRVFIQSQQDKVLETPPVAMVTGQLRRVLRPLARVKVQVGHRMLGQHDVFSVWQNPQPLAWVNSIIS